MNPHSSIYLHLLQGLKPDATLQSLYLHSVQIELKSPGREVARAFEDPMLPGIILTDQGRFRNLLSRARFLELMNLPLGHDLFSRRPALTLTRHLPVEVLIFPGNTSVPSAAARCLQRPLELLAEPVVVHSEENRYKVLDIHQLLLAQAHINDLTTRLLQRRKSELHALFRAMSDDVMIFNAQGYYYLVPGSCPRLLAASEGELVGKSVHELLNPEDAGEFSRQIRLCLESGETVNFEYRLEREGQIRWFTANLSPLDTDRVIMVAHDITRRKKTQQALQAEREKSERLLLNVLPASIAEQLKQQPGVIAEYFPEATLLFADLVGFTPLSSRLSPISLVRLLNRIFSAFDQLVAEYGLEKIKTIGDAYMVVGGLPQPREDHAEAMADLALAMREIIGGFEVTPPLQIRIGLNSGPVVAGVIGTHKFSYDLWGDTVNVASRMESKGEPGHIQVTEATYQHLRHRYQLAERGLINVKGKGEMLTYWLLGRK